MSFLVHFWGLASKKNVLIFFPKKTHSGKISYVFLKKTFFLYFGKWNFLALRLEKFLYFLKKAFLIFSEIELSSNKI